MGRLALSLFNTQPASRVQDHYQNVIREIMARYNLKPRYSSPIVPANATFERVLVHTDWYVHTNDTRPHYRYRRYLEILNEHLTVPERRLIHVDIGCGAGVFSWVLLDWASAKGLKFDRLDLYGFDHCTAMMNLAQEVRGRLAQHIIGYPDLNYFCDIGVFCDKLTENHSQGADYVITLGHALAQTQSNTPDDIDNYAKVMIHTLELTDSGSNCALVAIDADSARTKFNEGWISLMNSLTNAGISYEEQLIWKTPINDSGRAKFAWLCPE